VRSQVDARLDTLGLDKDDQDWVLAYAINALPVTQEGLPDIEQAHRVFVARETERQRQWAQGQALRPTSRRTGRPLPRSPTSTSVRTAWTGWSAACRRTSPDARRGGPQPSAIGHEKDAANRSEHGAGHEGSLDRRSPAEAVRGQERPARAHRVDPGRDDRPPGADAGLGRALGREHVRRRRRRQPEPGFAAADVNQALWTLVYNWFQIELDTSAIAQASGQSAQSIVGGKDLEIEGAVENQKHQMTRHDRHQR
jgi:hypothetical protein